jgi:hypothetical protein
MKPCNITSTGRSLITARPPESYEITTNTCKMNQLKSKHKGRLPTEEGKIRKENSISFVINLCVVNIISFDGFYAKIMLILYNITHDTTPPNAINILPTSIRITQTLLHFNIAM